MTTTTVFIVAIAVFGGRLIAQEQKPVAHEGSMIAITGLMKKGQYNPNGVGCPSR